MLGRAMFEIEQPIERLWFYIPISYWEPSCRQGIDRRVRSESLGDPIAQLDLLEQRAVDDLFAPVDPLPTDGSLSVLLDEPIDLKAKLAELSMI